MIAEQDTRQGIVVEFNKPRTILCRTHEHIRHNGLNRFRPERIAGFWVKVFQFRNHFLDVIKVNLAKIFQGRKIMFGHEMQVSHENCHGRIKPIAFPQLKSKAILKIGSEHADGIETFQFFQNTRHVIRCGAEIFRDVSGIGREVARLIHHADQVLANDAVRWIKDVQVQLIGKMFCEGCRFGKRRAEVIFIAVKRKAARWPKRCPAGIG